MFYVSPVMHHPPQGFQNTLQEKVYEALEILQIAFARVDTDEAITMADCVQINQRLEMQMVKTLFLCNRQQSAFYLFVTKGDKAFRSKDFSKALGIARVSFAPADKMQSILGTSIGAATIFSVLLESARDVDVILDQDVLNENWYGCSDGTTTGYMKVKTRDILVKLLPHAKRQARIIQV